VKADKGVEAIVKKVSALASAITRSPKRREALIKCCVDLDIKPSAPIKYGTVR